MTFAHLLVLIILGSCGYPARGQEVDDPAVLTPRLGEQGVQDGPWLEPGKPLVAELQGGESCSYRVDLKSGQYLEVAVIQQGIDVQVDIFGPDGEWVTTFDSSTGAQGREPALLVAEETGTHRFHVRSLFSAVSVGSYRIEIVELRESTLVDKHLHRALKAHSEATQTDYALKTTEGLRQALRKDELALRHWRAVGSELGQCLAHTRIGARYIRLGEPDEALRRFREALEHCPEKGAPRGAADPATRLRTLLGMRAKAYLSIGRVYNNLGDSATALDFARKALSERDMNPRQRGRALQLIGDIHVQMGQSRRAIDFFQQALSIEQTERHVSRQAKLWTRLGIAHDSLHEPRQALRAFHEALPLLQASVGHAPSSLGGCFLRIGRVHVSLGQNEEALVSYGKALDLAPAPVRRSAILSDLVELYAAMGKHEKARMHYEEALRLSEEFAVIGSAQIHRLSRLARDRGQLDEALDLSLQAIETAEGQWARIFNPHLKGPFLASQQGYFEFHVDLLMRLHRERPTGGFDIKAFETAEKARARNLLEALRWTDSEVPLGADPADFEKERRLRHQLEAWGRRESQRIQDQVTLSDVQWQAEEAERTNLMKRYQEVMARQRSSPRYAALRPPQPPDLREIQRWALAEDTLLLAYALGEERSFLWAVTTKTIDSFELAPRGEIEPLARRFYDLVSARSLELEFEAPDEKLLRVRQADADYAQFAARLSRLLLGPVAKRLAGRRLLIVADGMLHYVPFAALPRPDQPSADFAALLEYHEVVGAPSASVLIHLQRRGRPKVAGNTLAVLADPVFDADDPRAEKGSHGPLPVEMLRFGQDLGRLERLSGTGEEAEAILALAPASASYVGLDARREVVTGGAVEDSRIIHFATHAIIDARHPERSRIVLSLVNERGEPVNGFLTLHDVYQLNLGTELVVLSGCQTALGKEMRGEGLVGLTRGFLHAGASAVVASLWSVEDGATVQLMKRFYHGMLVEGQAPGAALRGAQLSMRREARWSAPYYWAGFVLQGNWQAAASPD